MNSAFCIPHVAALFCSSVLAAAAGSAPTWPIVLLPEARDVELSGPWGRQLQRGLDRLSQDPFTVDWLLADVSFKMNRIFTNYSGDVSGRFLELASLTSPRGKFVPSALRPVLGDVARYQRADGHFGVEVDLGKPLTKGSPPIPMLWGNARLLVGLVTAAREFNDPNLLQAAKRLGDFYVTSASQLCSPAREADYHSSGTYGDGYTCCYFPVIESLALLYRATKDERYLDQAKRVAGFFQKFDVLPVDHSHGNLCAWRGILDLYDLTRDRAYLDRARAKYDAAVRGGYVWPGGGVGEHWYVFFEGDEGCSESDWLRFCLELWRHTGETRYLDMAERLLENQYAADQCSNGGYGMRRFDGDAAGPIGTRGPLEEWPFCCSFHGPLGLHFLKKYLAAGSDDGIFLNFLTDFKAPVIAAGREWKLSVRAIRNPRAESRAEIELVPKTAERAHTTLWLRVPEGATNFKVDPEKGSSKTAPLSNGYVKLEGDYGSGSLIRVTFDSKLRLEGRKFVTVQPAKDQISRWKDVSILDGAQVLCALPATTSGRATLLACMDPRGQLSLLPTSDGSPGTVMLPGLDATVEEVRAALETGRPVALRPWPEIQTRRRAGLAHDVVVVPVENLPATALAKFTERARKLRQDATGPFFGDKLEAQADLWIGASGWKFTPVGLSVSGGDIGLIDGEGYENYRFEFDLTLPKEGQGISGWVVRAASSSDCLMFQLQSADSPYSAFEFKTRPNTLRPHLRRNGAWQVAEPVPLPKEVRRGETHRIAVECKADTIQVFLDGAKIHTQNDSGFRRGQVGFRAAGPAEEGLFANVSLKML
jgi:hypothetical protein